MDPSLSISDALATLQWPVITEPALVVTVVAFLDVGDGVGGDM